MQSKIEKVLNVDYRTEAGHEAIQSILHKFKPFAKYTGQDVPLGKLEKFASVITTKYNISPQWITIDTQASDKSYIYSCSIVSRDTRDWLGTVYGCSMYELFAKLVIKMVVEAKASKGSKR